MKAPKTTKPSRDRSNTVMIDLADLRGILERLAHEDAPQGESPNMSRTVRQLDSRRSDPQRNVSGR